MPRFFKMPKRGACRTAHKAHASFLACGLAAALCLGAWGAYRFYRPNCAAAAQYAVQGVDVSEYQGEIDWPALARQGISFAFVKATEGSGYTDPFFAQNLSGAQAAGLYAGAYHFFSYDSPGQTQAENFIAAVPQTPGALPPVVDVEYYGSYYLFPQQAQEARRELGATLDGSIRRMAAASELEDFGVWRPVIESVVYEGLYAVGAAVLNGTFHTRRGRERNNPLRKAGSKDA